MLPIRLGAVSCFLFRFPFIGRSDGEFGKRRKREDFFVANPSWPIGLWLVKRYGSCFEGVFVFPSDRRKKSSSRSAECILVDWTNKSYGMSLGRYAHRRNPIGAGSGIHEVHFAIVM